MTDPTMPVITEEQVRKAAAAALEVLSGADQQRTLQLLDELVVARLVLRSIATGENIVGRRAVTPPEEAPPTG